MTQKPWYESRTLWIAVLQAVFGLFLAFGQANPTLAEVGWFAIAKSCLDAAIRLLTAVPIE